MRYPIDHLRYIIKTAYLMTSEIANIVDIEKEEIDKFLNDKNEFKEITYIDLFKITRLSSLVKEMESLEITRMAEMINRPIFSGRSLIDRFKTYENTPIELVVLKRLADKEANDRILNQD